MNIASGLILGMVYVAAPGPIGMATLRQGVKGGVRASLAVQAGSLTGLVLYALLAWLGTGRQLQGAEWQIGIGLGGTAVLFYLGLATIREGRALVSQPYAGCDDRLSIRRAFGLGAFLSLANPLEIFFWISLQNRLLQTPGLDGSLLLAAFLLGCGLASLLLVLIAGFWRARLPTRLLLAFSWVCGLTFIAFSVKLAVSLWQQLGGA